jgi:hypothetical protein
MKCGQALLGILIGALAGCGGKSSLPTGVTCTFNTDCQNPLSCTFGRCHETCRESRDCPSGHRCVAAPGGAVCQLEGKCAYLSDCPVPLVCALDRQCRSECQQDRDCATKTQKCVLPDRVCAESEEVDTGGKLKNAQDGGVPAAPPGVDAGARPDSAVNADAEVPGSGDAGASDGPAPSPDLARDMNVGDIPVGPCGFQDPNEPGNDQRESSTPLTPEVPVVGCVAGKDPTVDSDYYELVAPNDPAGGYFQVAITDVGPDKIGATTFAASDNTIILDPLGAADQGASLNLFFAAAPGQHYRVRIAYGTYDFLYKQPFRYTIKATYTKVSDAYEPNDTRASARPIALGTPISAFSFAGFTTGHAGFANGTHGAAPTADWYKVDAAAGMLKATVENTAGDLRIGLFVYDSLGTERGRADSVTFGAGASLMVPTMAGSYFVQVVSGDQGPVAAGASANVSPSFTTPYTLTVTQ